MYLFIIPLVQDATLPRSHIVGLVHLAEHRTVIMTVMPNIDY